MKGCCWLLVSIFIICTAVLLCVCCQFRILFYSVLIYLFLFFMLVMSPVLSFTFLISSHLISVVLLSQWYRCAMWIIFRGGKSIQTLYVSKSMDTYYNYNYIIYYNYFFLVYNETFVNHFAEMNYGTCDRIVWIELTRDLARASVQFLTALIRSILQFVFFFFQLQHNQTIISNCFGM